MLFLIANKDGRPMIRSSNLITAQEVIGLNPIMVTKKRIIFDAFFYYQYFVKLKKLRNSYLKDF